MTDQSPKRLRLSSNTFLPSSR